MFILAHVTILAATALHRAAWEALLSQQPGIEAWGSAANVDDVAVLVQAGCRRATILFFHPILYGNWRRWSRRAAFSAWWMRMT